MRVPWRNRRVRGVNGAVRWVMWDPSRAQTVLYAVAGVVIVAVAVFVFRASLWVDTNRYQSEVAARSAATAPPTDPSLTLVAPTQTATVAPLTPAPLADAGGDPEKAPQDAAKAFLRAWTSATAVTTQSAWLRRLEPHTAPALLRGFRSTDRTKVPTGPVTVLSSRTLTDVGSSYVSAKVGSAGTVAVTLDLVGGRWVVSDVAPE